MQRRLRQNVLTGMLLHMVETPGPVYRTLHLLIDIELGHPLHLVQDLIVLLKHISNRLSTYVPKVVRLASGSRVERGGRQLNNRSVWGLPQINDPARKLGQKRVGIVESFGQDLAHRVDTMGLRHTLKALGSEAYCPELVLERNS